MRPDPNPETLESEKYYWRVIHKALEEHMVRCYNRDQKLATMPELLQPLDAWLFGQPEAHRADLDVSQEVTEAWEKRITAAQNAAWRNGTQLTVFGQAFW
jgi:hypothetical protein